jgi:hypothetical protein
MTPVAASAVPAVHAVTAQVHQQHAAEQARVEHGREGDGPGHEKGGRDDPDRQAGHQPAEAGERRGDGRLALKRIDGVLGMVKRGAVNVGGHD